MLEGTEAIKERILQDARNEAEQIIRQAEEKAKQILHEMEKRVKDSRDKRLEEGRRYVEEAAARSLADTRVEYRRLLSEEKEKLFEEVCRIVLEGLREFSGTEKYLETLQNLVIEAGVILGGGRLLVHLNESDKARLRAKDLGRIAKEIEKITQRETSIEIAGSPIDSIGGAIVARRGEDVSVDNTFEERLQRIREERRADVYRILFEE